MILHKRTFYPGLWRFIADADGMAATTIREVMSLRWWTPPESRASAAYIARHNRAVLKAARRARKAAKAMMVTP